MNFKRLNVIHFVSWNFIESQFIHPLEKKKRKDIVIQMKF